MRFQVFTPDRTKVYKCDTLKQVVEWLKTKDMGLEEYWVEDLKDDIEVIADELLSAWKDSERPKDLQMF